MGSEPTITVLRSEFLDAYQQIRNIDHGTKKKLRSKNPPVAYVTIRLSGGLLELAFAELFSGGFLDPSTVITVPARGHWQGTVGVGRATFENFVKILPEQEELTFSVKDGKLHIEGLSLSCVVTK